jgi:redox-sensitive bicupin YhaK (pirin superfamily)
VQLEPGASFEEDFSVDHGVLAYVIKGSAFIGSERQRVGVRQAARFSEGRGAVLLRATSAGAQVVLLAGRPLREPVVAHGPFIMNNEQQITSAIERYRAGRMGRLESST